MSKGIRPNVRIVALLALSVSGAADAPAQPLPWRAAAKPEMTRLVRALAGRWTTTETHEPNPFLKSGMTGKGVFRNRAGPGGNSLIMEYRSTSPKGSYESVRTIYWDDRNKVYREFYCDSLQPTGCGESGSGHWVNGQITFENVRTAAHQDSLRHVLLAERPDRYSLEVDALDRGTWVRTLIIRARKG